MGRNTRLTELPAVRAALEGSIGLRADSSTGLRAELTRLSTERLASTDERAISRLKSCETALARAAEEGQVIRAVDWKEEVSGRIRSVSPCIQQIPRAVRPFLCSEIPGHVLIDIDLAGAHGMIAADLAREPAAGWCHTSEGRRVIAGGFGWAAPTEAQLKAVKRALLAMQLGASEDGVFRDHLQSHGVTTEAVGQLFDWWRSRTPNIQSLISWVRQRYAEWEDSGRPKPGMLVRDDTRCVYVRPRRRQSWRGALAVLLQSYEADIMARTLANLHTVPDARLVAPIYDGILVSAPHTRATQVAYQMQALMHEACRGITTTTVKMSRTWPC